MVDMSTKDDGLVEGYLSECEDKNRTLEWSLGEATKEIERLRAEVESYRQTIRLSLGYREAIAIQIEDECDADD